MREAVEILDQRRVDFEYDGEMAADVALNPKAMAAYPFCRLSGPANVLVMPAYHSAAISTKMLQELGGSTVIGPLLVGLDKPVQIVSLGADGLRHRQHGGAGGVQSRGLVEFRAQNTGGIRRRGTGLRADIETATARVVRERPNQILDSERSRGGESAVGRVDEVVAHREKMAAVRAFEYQSVG